MALITIYDFQREVARLRRVLCCSPCTSCSVAEKTFLSDAIADVEADITLELNLNGNLIYTFSGAVEAAVEAANTAMEGLGTFSLTAADEIQFLSNICATFSVTAIND